MAFDKRGLANYVEVNERIVKFYEKYPDGSIQSEIIEHTDEMVTVKAWAFRTADDPRPGVGHSSLLIPGSTPYTKGSELENAETSAWGRALAALGFEVKRGIASREEVENKLDDPLDDEPAPKRERVTTEESQVPPKAVTPEVMLSEGQVVLASKILGALVALGKPAIVADATTKWGAVKGWPQALFEKRYGHLVTEAKKAAGNDAERVKILENAEVPF